MTMAPARLNLLLLLLASAVALLAGAAGAAGEPVVAQTQHSKKTLTEKGVRAQAHQLHSAAAKLLGGGDPKAAAAKLTPTWSTTVPPKGIGALAEGKKNLRFWKYVKQAKKCKDCHFETEPKQ